MAECLHAASVQLMCAAQPLCMAVHMYVELYGAASVQPVRAVHASMNVRMHAAGAARVQPMSAVHASLTEHLHAGSVQLVCAARALRMIVHLYAVDAASVTTCVGCTDAGKLMALVMQAMCAA